MMKTVSVQNVSKRFVLKQSRSRSLADGLRGLLGGNRREEFWALREVSFDVERGEALGIIGHNGAGKSTMLKLLTGIMKPTEGRIRTRGRVSALIEVGAGFHPEMTGRENVYLNGSILGMTRREIDRKFDDIVAFAELEQFIDTPVKRYSSGMYVRLGFAVAAHIEPEVLIVDEVLSVGDADFQARCSTRMRDLRNAGTTIVFVSHNLGAVESFCSRTIVMDHGRAVWCGDSAVAVNVYLDRVKSARREQTSDLPVSIGPVSIEDLVIRGGNRNEVGHVGPGEDVEIAVRCTVARAIARPQMRVGVYDERFGTLCLAVSEDNGPDVLPAGRCVWKCTFHKLPLRPRHYEVWFGLRGLDDMEDIVPWRRLGGLNVTTGDKAILGCDNTLYAPVIAPYSTRFELT